MSDARDERWTDAKHADMAELAHRHKGVSRAEIGLLRPASAALLQLGGEIALFSLSAELERAP